MNDPIISIVLPVYNAEKTINDTCGVYTIWGGSKKDVSILLNSLFCLNAFYLLKMKRKGSIIKNAYKCFLNIDNAEHIRGIIPEEIKKHEFRREKIENPSTRRRR